MKNEITRQESQLIKKQHLNGLAAHSNKLIRNYTPAEAYNKGLNLRAAVNTDGQTTRILLLGHLERLVRSVNATRSFQTEEDLYDAVDDIIEIFPTLKVEEILVCFKYIRQGKYELYGNLTTNTLIKCLHQYDLDNTVRLREQEHLENKNKLPYHTAHIDWQRLADQIVIEPEKKSLEELGGHVHITAHDLQEIQRAKEEAQTKEKKNTN
jgi:hypothetical protein